MESKELPTQISKTLWSRSNTYSFKKKTIIIVHDIEERDIAKLVKISEKKKMYKTLNQQINHIQKENTSCKQQKRL